MARHFTRIACLLPLLACVLMIQPATVAAQSPTGTITGRVTDSQGGTIPGVTVTVESPALQGSQRTVTSTNGAYIFTFLPPGVYTVTFQIQGFSTAKQTRSVAAAEPVSLDVVLEPAQTRETVTVTADAATFINTVEGATNVKQTLLQALPTNRDMLAAVNLAPAVHATGPNANYSIAGAMSFENLFMVNGVAVQDNLRGDPFDLFIEDAIQETTVLSSGVSAEYGRFSGGIVNTLTKSGGNLFSGSGRVSFANDNWRTVSPFGERKVDQTVPTYEGTFGGPVLRDRLWFFVAGRALDSTVSRETGYTRIPYDRTEQEQRFEVKATQAIKPGHRVEVNYLGIERTDLNSAWPSSSTIMDLASLTKPETPQSLFGLHYTGTIGSRLSVEAQYSSRALTFKKSGGLSTDLITGTPLLDQQTGAWWWAPNFCGVCADEERNNDSLLIKGSYFLSTAAGSHNVVFGYDGFNDKMRSDNHQSGSDYHVWATGSFIEDGVVYPVIEPGFSTYIIHWPLQQNAKHTNFRTHSFFVNDSWAANRHLSFNLGVRYDKNAGRDSSGSLVADDSAISPRLGLVWDPAGDGQTSINLSMGRYVAALNNNIAGAASPAGTPSIIAFFYDGAPINAGAGPLVPTDAALRQVFNWFNAADPFPFYVDIPGVATKVQGPLKSPHADEIAVGVSRQIGARGSVRADFVNRKFADFYTRRIDTSTGVVFDDFGQPYDLKLIENTNDLKRQYRALNLQGSYRGTDLTLGGSYTLSRLWGNADGETVGNGPIPGTVTMYPEYLDVDWYEPEGDLSADQRHRARLWATYQLPWGRGLMNTSIGAIQTLQSGTPYGAVGEAVVAPFVADFGYILPPATNTYYFTARDAFRTAASYRTDLSVNISRQLGGGRSPEAFASFPILNVFNQFQVFRNTGSEINTTVTSAVDDASLSLFNPFTETPVEGVHWKKGDEFGQPVARGAYTLPRTFSFSVGVKF